MSVLATRVAAARDDERMRWMLLGAIWECLTIQLSITQERNAAPPCPHPIEHWEYEQGVKSCGVCGATLGLW